VTNPDHDPLPRVPEFETWRSAPAAPTGRHRASAAPIVTYDWELSPDERRKSRRPLMAALATAGLATVVAGIVFLSNSTGAPSQPAARQPPSHPAVAAVPVPATGAPASPAPPRTGHPVAPAAHSHPAHQPPASTTPTHQPPPVTRHHHHHHHNPRMCPVKDNGVIVAYVPC
jgi:hypothetical protein